MILRSCFIGVGLSVICPLLAGMGTVSLPAKAEETVLVAQQSELEEADALLQEGMQLLEEGSADSLRRVIEVWKQAASLFAKASDRENEAITLLGIGRIHSLLGESEQALSYYEQALPLLRAVEDRASEATTLNNIGDTYYSLGKRAQALSYYEQALPLMREIGYQAGEATTLNNMGGTYHSIGESERALSYYEQALSLSRATGDRAGEASTLNNIGRAYHSLGERQQALSYYEQALSLSRAAGDRTGEANTLSGIGSAYYSMGESERALSYYEQALSLMREIGCQAGEATTLNNMGRAYDSVGEREQALSYYGQALSLGRAVGDRAGEATTLNNIGGVYDFLGESEQALAYYGQALPLMRAVGNRAGEATTLNNIGGAYYSLGESEQALSYYEQALLLMRAVGDRAGEATTLNNLGSVYDSLGRSEQALSYHEQALLLRRAVGDPAGEATTLNNLGRTYYSLGKSEQALAYYEQALLLRGAVGDRAGEATTLGNIAFLYQQQQKLSDALAAINSAVNLIEGLRLAVSPGELRTSYFSTVQDFYELKSDIQMQIGQPEAAFETSEASRARLLTELLNESNVDIRQGISPELLQEEQSLKRGLAQIEQQLIALRSGEHTPEQAAALDQQSNSMLQQLDQVVAQIRRTSPAYAEIIQPQPLSLAQIQQEVLDSDTVLLQYALGQEQSYLWIVGQENFQAYTLPEAAKLQAAAARFQSVTSIKGNPQNEAKRQGDELANLILPERPDWLAGKRLLVVGDGILSEVSFAALPLPNQTDYVPLLTEHEVLTQPSITAISVLREQLASRELLPPSLAVLADPVYRADDDRLAQAAGKQTTNDETVSVTERNLRDLDLRTIERLPYTRTEANSILQLATKNNLQSISALDFEADIDWMNTPALADYSLVHLATHGFINPVNPQLSGLVLSLVNESGQLKEDGFLHLHDIFNLKLAAELVVLSACQTGNGEAIGGEGIVGLSRGFMYAGAERVAVSLWNVNDQATAALMANFYRYLLEENMTPAAAMRAAQLEAWQSGQAPYLWAAFTLQGEWQP